MPIKLPKTFSRRKSSGNVLDELDGPQAPSFRVLTRDEVDKPLADGGNNKPESTKHGRQYSSPVQKWREQPYEDGGLTGNNRGSSGTNSGSSGFYDTSSSSARLSSSSTLPSSAEAETSDELFPRKHYPGHRMNGSDSHVFSLRGPAKTFAFGSKAAGPTEPALSKPRDTGADIESDRRDLGSPARDRAMTTSSYASTAVPPKLDSDLDLGASDFGNLFDGIGKRKSAVLGIDSSQDQAAAAVRSESTPALPAKPYSAPKPTYTPPPIRVDTSRDIEPSPFSWDRSSPRNGHESSPQSTQFTNNGGQRTARPDELGSIIASPQPSATSPHDRRTSRMTPFRASAQSSQSSRPVEDADARIVMQSFRASRTLDAASGGASSKSKGTFGDAMTDGNGQPSSASNSSSKSSINAPSSVSSTLFASEADQGYRQTRATTPETLFGNDKGELRDTTPRAKKFEADPSTSISNGMLHSSTDGCLKLPQSESISRPVSLAFDKSVFDGTPYLNQQKEPESPLADERASRLVMTKAEFERRQQERSTNESLLSASESEDSDYDEDEDEAERNRRAVTQRRKQEADLAVYRQQMKKVTGEQPRELPNSQLRPARDRASHSTPELVPHAATSLNLTSASVADSKASSEEDPDENVPLAFLQAAGFPNKNRPPSKPTGSAGSFVLRPPSVIGHQLQRPSSSGPQAAGARPQSGLPPFARKLPQDPYLGAGLVNHSNRESLSFGRSTTNSVYGAGNLVQPALPPGGLVGVIAGEERARAMRRGSPNGHSYPGHFAQQGAPAMLPPQTMGTRASMVMGGTQNGSSVVNGQGMMAAIPGAEQMAEQMAHFNQLMETFMQMHSVNLQMQMQGQMQPVQQPHMPLPQFAVPQPGNSTLAPGSHSMRPMSIVSHNPSLQQHQQHQQRTMSMMHPPGSVTGNRWSNLPLVSGPSASVHNMPIGQSEAYAPSIAPSERSNVGMAPRYRPVSQIPDAMSATSSGLQTVTNLADSQSRKSVTVRAVEKIKGLGGKSHSPNRLDGAREDSDDEGWSSMKKRKERVRASRPATSSAPSPPLKDLYFDGI